MEKWDNELRESLISCLSYASTCSYVSFNAFFERGVTMQDILNFDAAIHLVRRHPAITEDELAGKGISVKKQEVILGGIMNFKSLLGIEVATFEDWLLFKDTERPVKVDYWMYVEYASEIKRKYVREGYLTHNLFIAFDEHLTMTGIVIEGIGRLLPPATNGELAKLVIRMLSEKFSFVAIDNNVITFSPRRSKSEIRVEVNCFSSRLEHTGDMAICVVDDATLPSLYDLKPITLQGLLLKGV